jgi:phosphate transport system substrate-binding protein
MKKTPVVILIMLVLSILVGACAAPAAQQTQAPAATQATQPTQPPAATTAPQKTEEAMATEAPMEESKVMLPEVNPLEVKGAIVTAGSSTVYPLTEAMATRFKDEGYSDQITIDSIGSGAGLERFCVTGETDIANSSRPIKDSEVESCKAINRTPVEFRVGTDALAVVVSKENTFITNATLEQLALLFSTAEKWSDVDPSWPAETIVRYIPGTDSGTFDYFVEAVFDNDKEPILAAKNNNLSEDDNVLVQGVEGSPYAIGFFGYAYYEENADKLNILSIEGIEPTFETVEGGTYPLARPLFIYSDPTIMQTKPQVAAFINFYLTYVNEEIEKVGYFPASTAALDQAKQNWLDAMK